MKPFRTALWALFFAFVLGAIASAVLHDARRSQMRELLEAVDAAERTLPHAGTRLLVGSETTRFKVWSSDGRRHIEWMGSKDEEKSPRRRWGGRSFGGFPMLFRSGSRRRIKDYDLALTHYEARIVEQEEVAGRKADVIEFSPRHAGRATYRLSADVENRFPLRFCVLRDGRRVFESSFEEITFSPPPREGSAEERRRPSRFKVATEEVSLDQAPGRVPFPVWVPKTLPAGFRLHRAEVTHVRGEAAEDPAMDSALLHLQFTDGMAAFSVVECGAESDVWGFFRRFSRSDPEKSPDGKIVAQRFTDRMGAAYLMQMGKTVIMTTGTIPPGEIEAILGSFASP